MTDQPPSDQPQTGQLQTGSPKDTHYANLRRAHRDAKRARGEIPKGGGKGKTAKNDGQAPLADGRVRLYGLHTVAAALQNPKRVHHRLLATRNAMPRLGIAEADLPCPFEIVEPKRLDRDLGGEAVHQGVLLETEPLAPVRLSSLGRTNLVIVLDQVTDPHNVGAIMRSATAFAAGALVTTARHSPQESGVLAKAASGALEHVPHIEVVNLADALGELSKAGFCTIGLDSEGPSAFEEALTGGKLAIVLGAEGKGLRQKTRETVDCLARLEMPGAIRSLNVSNAAAVALYASARFLSRV